MKCIIIILFILLPFLSSAQVKKTSVKKVVASKAITNKTTTSKVAKTSAAAKSKTAASSKKPAASNKKTDSIGVNNNSVKPVSLTAREQEMVNEINSLRADPPKYSTYVNDYLQKMNSGKQERAAAKELVAILKNMKQLNPLTINMTMYSDAKKYGAEMAKEDMPEHSSLPYYENISLGHKDIREAMIDMLIDDGIPDRGHRNNLLNEKIKQVAVVELPGTINGFPYCYIQEFK